MLLRSCLVALALLVPLASAQAQEQRPVVVGMALEPPHLDPTAGAAAAIDEVTYANVFEGLTQIAQDGSVQPALATDWTVSEDGLTVTFTLREGVDVPRRRVVRRRGRKVRPRPSTRRGRAERAA